MAQVWKWEGSLQELGFSSTVWVLGSTQVVGLGTKCFTHWSISLAPDHVVWKLGLGLNSPCKPNWLQTCRPPRPVIFNPVLLIRKVRQRESKVHACCLVLHSGRLSFQTIQSPPWILLEMGSERDLSKGKSHRPAFHPSTGMLRRIGGKYYFIYWRGPFVFCKCRTEGCVPSSSTEWSIGANREARPETP